MQEIFLRKAEIKDLKEVTKLFKEAIKSMDKNGIYQCGRS